MTWEIALQTISAGMAGIAMFFLYDLVREFKTFKSETKRDILNLEKQREEFKTTVRNYELSSSIRTNELQKLHNDFNLKVSKEVANLGVDIMKIHALTTDMNKKTETFNDFFSKSLSIMKRFDLEIKSMKVQIKDLIIFKNGKT